MMNIIKTITKTFHNVKISNDVAPVTELFGVEKGYVQYPEKGLRTKWSFSSLMHISAFLRRTDHNKKTRILAGLR